MRTKLRTASDAPRAAMSKTDNENTDPMRDMPNSDKDDPSLQKDLTDIDAPK
jgi:hypothetical protein